MIIRQTEHAVIPMADAEHLPEGSLLGWWDDGGRGHERLFRVFVRVPDRLRGPHDWTELMNGWSNPLHEEVESMDASGLPDGHLHVLFIPREVHVALRPGDQVASEQELHELGRYAVVTGHSGWVYQRVYTERRDIWQGQLGPVSTAQLWSHEGGWLHVVSVPTPQQRAEIEPGSAADRSGLSPSEL